MKYLFIGGSKDGERMELPEKHPTVKVATRYSGQLPYDERVETYHITFFGPVNVYVVRLK